MAVSASEKGLELSEMEIKLGARILRQILNRESEPRTRGVWEPEVGVAGEETRGRGLGPCGWGQYLRDSFPCLTLEALVGVAPVGREGRAQWRHPLCRLRHVQRYGAVRRE